MILAEKHRCQSVVLTLPAGTNARTAAQLSAEAGIQFKGTGANPDDAPLGVYSLRVSDDYVLQERDRLEVYRALEQNPMELRRQRARSGG